MGRIYKNQSKLRIRLTCAEDITDCTAKIKYVKPSGATGTWDAEIEDAEEGIIYYDVSSDEVLDEVGAWTVWAHITYDDSKVAIGEPAQIAVYDEGTFNVIRTKVIRGE
jgi:hypothetical protein